MTALPDLTELAAVVPGWAAPATGSRATGTGRKDGGGRPR